VIPVSDRADPPQPPPVTERYLERYLEEVPLGVTRVFGDHLLTEEAIIDFASRWDPRPFHIDPRAGAASVFGGLSACAAHLFAIVSLLNLADPEPVVLLAGLGAGEMAFRSPGRPGDHISMRRTYLTARPSATRPDAGIVTQRLELVDETSRIILYQNGAILVARQS